MSSRQETQLRKAALRKSLLDSFASGRVQVGQLIPPIRELARQFNLSVTLASSVVRELVDEGLLTTQFGGGTARSAKPQASPAPRTSFAHSAAGLRVGVIWKGEFDSNTASPNTWAPLIISAERFLSSRGVMCISVDLAHPSMTAVTAEDVLDKMRQQGVQGILSIVDRAPAEIDNIIDAATSLSMPIVHAGGQLSRGYRLAAYFSSVDVGFQATKHLIERGCGRVLVFSAFTAPWVVKRIIGAKEAADDAGRPNAIEEHVADIDLYSRIDRPGFEQQDLARETAASLLVNGLRWDGVMAVNDMNAHGFIDAARERGLVAGDDYAIVGVDDAAGSALLGLSSLRAPLEGLGREAALMLLREIDQPGLAMSVRLPSELVARYSTMNWLPETPWTNSFAKATIS